MIRFSILGSSKYLIITGTALFNFLFPAIAIASISSSLSVLIKSIIRWSSIIFPSLTDILRISFFTVTFPSSNNLFNDRFQGESGMSFMISSAKICCLSSELFKAVSMVFTIVWSWISRVSSSKFNCRFSMADCNSST